MKRVVGFLVLSVILSGSALAHSGKPKYHVVIDTDGAVDDMRAISMLLSGNDIRVLAITCSQGTLLPATVCAKVQSLLSAFHHEGIPVGIGEEVNFELPAWATFARDVRWAGETHNQNLAAAGKSIDVLNNTLASYPNKVTLIALGSLKTYADWIRANKNNADKIDRIIWYNNHKIEDGFNYQVSPESFEYLRQSGILIEIVAGTSGNLLVDEEYLNQLRHCNSMYARQIEEVHSQASVVEKIKDSHLQLWDDMVPMYLFVPVVFDIEKKQTIKFVSINQNLPPGFVYEAIGKLLLSASSTNNRIFLAFPTDTALYKPYYSGMVDETIEEFGLIEWKAITMTNEIHGHTGIYSIIGAKMGIRALEYFNVGVNNLEVLTFAGNVPPLSCFNDGIQISTGATIGQGLITVSDSISVIPSAIFTFNNQGVRMAVKPEIGEQMRKEIAFVATTYGLLSDQYWLYIEELARKYWADFDRHKIFIVE